MAPLSLDIYTPLSITKRQIRLLQLASAPTLADQVKCRLQVVSLENHPSFDAISYAWCGQPIPVCVVPRDHDFPPVVSHPSDDPSATKPIGVNGQLWSIGANLDSALRHFRDPITTKYVWADALCTYSKRTTIHCFRNLRFPPQFSEGFKGLFCPPRDTGQARKILPLLRHSRLQRDYPQPNRSAEHQTTVLWMVTYTYNVPKNAPLL
jgi:hypothetical protein